MGGSRIVDDFVAALKRREPRMLRANLERESPEMFALGHSSQAIEAVASEMGCAAPPELRALHDAMHDVFVCFSTSTYRELLAPSAAREVRAMILKEAREFEHVVYRPGWLPVFSHGDGNYDVIDLDRSSARPGDAPVLYVYTASWTGHVFAPSFAEHLRLLTIELDAQDSTEDPMALRARMAARGTASLLESYGGHLFECPRCHWEPRSSDVWACDCGHEWNTFVTGGKCPRCAHAWMETQCLCCAAVTPHASWYLSKRAN